MQIQFFVSSSTSRPGAALQPKRRVKRVLHPELLRHRLKKSKKSKQTSAQISKVAKSN